MLTNNNLTLLRHILSKIEALRRKHLRTNRLLKVLIRYNPIAINIKSLEDVLELPFRNRDAPKIQVIFQLSSANLPRFLNIQIHECFSKGFPLDSNLIDNSIFHITPLHHIRRFNLIFTLKTLLVFEMLFELWVFYGVMPKIKAFRKMNRRAKPFGKVCVAEVASAVVSLRINKLSQILIIKVRIITKIF